MKAMLALGASLLCVSLASADTWTTGTAGQVTTSATGTKVGVGTTGTPAEKLTVAGGSVLIDNNQYLKGKQSSGTSTNLLGLTTGNQLNLGGANPTLGLSTGSATRMLIDASGNVGVGMTASGRRLDVSGTARATSFEGDGGKLINVAPVGSFSVTQYGAVPNQTANDYRTAFQNALNAAAPKGGVVFVPPGQYKISGPLTIARGVTLQGSWQGAHDAKLARGTTLRADYSVASTTSPFITLDEDAAIMGVTIFYPQQVNSTSYSAYPWTIKGGFDADIENVTLANSYKGIQLSENSHLVRNVNMTAFSEGISIDNCLDISRLENVHIHPKFWISAMGWAYTSDGNGVPTGRLWEIIYYTIRNLTGFKFMRTDWQEVSGSFVIWAKTGMQVTASPTVPSGASATIVNSGMDMCQTALFVDRTDGFGGISFANTLLIGQTVISKTDLGPVRFTNCTFHPAFQAENPNRTTTLIYHNAPSTLTVTSSLFYDWDVPRAGHGAITMNDGICLFNQNEFMPPYVGRPATVLPPLANRLHFNMFNNSALMGNSNRFGDQVRYNLSNSSSVELTSSVNR